MACVEEKNQRRSKEPDGHMRWRGDSIPSDALSCHQVPEQHLGGSDPYSAAASVRSSQSLKEEQAFTSDFTSRGNRATSLQLKMGKFT